MANRIVHYSNFMEAVKDYNAYENGETLPDIQTDQKIPQKITITSAEEMINQSLTILKAGNELTGVIFAPQDSFDGQIIEGHATGDFFRRKNESGKWNFYTAVNMRTSIKLAMGLKLCEKGDLISFRVVDKGKHKFMQVV